MVGAGSLRVPFACDRFGGIVLPEFIDLAIVRKDSSLFANVERVIGVLVRV
jgi:hypothetical protein